MSKYLRPSTFYVLVGDSKFFCQGNTKVHKTKFPFHFKFRQRWSPLSSLYPFLQLCRGCALDRQDSRLTFWPSVLTDWPPSRTFEKEQSALFERSRNKKFSCTKVEPNGQSLYGIRQEPVGKGSPSDLLLLTDCQADIYMLSIHTPRHNKLKYGHQIFLLSLALL